MLPVRQLQNKTPSMVQSTENNFHCKRKYLILVIVFGVLTLLLLSILLVLRRNPIYRPPTSSSSASPSSSATRPSSMNITDLHESSTEATSSTRILSPTKASISSSMKKTTTATVSPIEDERCLMPEGNSCTAMTPDETKSAGLGVYYEYPCIGVGCNFMGIMCRLCAKHPSLIGRPYPKCPACVLDKENF